MNTINKTFVNLVLAFFLIVVIPLRVYSQNENVKDEIMKNGKTIRKAFSDGDIEKIKSLHHPEVIKALGYNDLKIGRDEVINGVKETLQNFNLEFIKNDVENILIRENIAIEQTKFSIKGTPKNGGESFIFTGRTMVTYIRYENSPTGWATIREIIQPATE
ncbi:nuclear transport factor 2 family protein [Ulvibacterium sp.]|uniref:nuclear transport factor 2 family protein n=1 Tax=Ulvibacterium sp. TaxID=2665914 RepID=UPI00262E28F0|nr:nuclear transport factor 2 family protein [Ulvibacterium sp.]